MSSWQGVHRELAGAWRSLRYDLARRSAAKRRPERAVPSPTDRTVPWRDARRPRRLLAMTAFGALAVVGATGTYFGVVAGLGALLADQAAPAEQPPAAVAPHRPVTRDVVVTPEPTAYPAVIETPAPVRRATASRSPSPRRGGEVRASRTPSTAPTTSSPTPVRTSPAPTPSRVVPSSVGPSPVVTPSPSVSSSATPTPEPSWPPSSGHGAARR